MIDIKMIQRAMQTAGFYHGNIDGDFGPKSKAARTELLTAKVNKDAAKWTVGRQDIALQQWVMKTVGGIDTGKIDGYMGPQTRFALQKWQDFLRDYDPPKKDIAHMPKIFPRYADIKSFYGKPGTNHTKIDLPYPMRIAWDKGKTIERFTINKHCAESAVQAYGKIKEHYGVEKIKSLGLDLWGGCYSDRTMRGGSRLSTHAFAAAIDHDPENNQLRWNSKRARMAKAEYAPFLDAWESVGWVSLGRERNYDYMHVQAVRL